MTATEPRPSATLARVGNGSLTGRTTNALLDAILNRQFPDNRLPPEPELAEQLAVSRTTIRAALQSLERLGVLSRAPGRGTMVRAHVGRESIVLQRLIGFRGLLLERHDEVQVDQRYWVRDHADDVGVRTLRIPQETTMIVSEKTFVADGHPAIHISDQIRCTTARPRCRSSSSTAATCRCRTRSSSSVARGRAGRSTTPSSSSSQPWLPRQAQTLQIEDGTPFMRLLETHHSAAGEPVAMSEVHVDDRYVRFQVVRHD